MPSIRVSEAARKKCDNRRCCFTQWDTLLHTLHLSRIFGVAPVSFKKDRSECPMVVSLLATVYSYALISILHIGVLSGVALDLQADPLYAVRVRTLSSSVAFILEILLLMILISVGAYNGPRRMSHIIQVLEVVDKINFKIGGTIHQRCRKKYLLGMIAIVLWAVLLLSTDYLTFYFAAHNQHIVIIVHLYICFYVELFTTILLELQFMWIALLVASCLESVNNGLENLVQATHLQREPIPVAVNQLAVGSLQSSVPARKMNALIDTLYYTHVRNSGRQTATETLERVRQLMVAYGTLCDVISGVNDSFGWLLVIFIVSFILHFVITPFYLIGYLNSPDRNTPMNIVNQLMFCIHHSLLMLMVVEPGYRTEKQAERTHILVRQLIQGLPSPTDPLAEELDVFLKQIVLNKASYTPLGVCTITRPLITIIVGGATTYLVIILQFQQIDTSNWALN